MRSPLVTALAPHVPDVPDLLNLESFLSLMELRDSMKLHSEGLHNFNHSSQLGVLQVLQIAVMLRSVTGCLRNCPDLCLHGCEVSYLPGHHPLA